jgi:hypothetical protein
MCTVSLTLCGAMDMTIYNHYSDIELVSPIYFCNNGTYNEYPVERTNTGAVMNIGLKFGLDKLPGGIVIYEIQRKGDIEPDHQSSTDTTSTKLVEDTLKMMRLLVVWKNKHSGKPIVHIVLVEHSNSLVLDEDKLAQLYNKMDDQFSRNYDSFQSTWLVYDDTALIATYEVVQKEDLGLKIDISQGVESEDTMRPMWIDSER